MEGQNHSAAVVGTTTGCESPVDELAEFPALAAFSLEVLQIERAGLDERGHSCGEIKVIVPFNRVSAFSSFADAGSCRILSNSLRTWSSVNAHASIRGWPEPRAICRDQGTRVSAYFSQSRSDRECLGNSRIVSRRVLLRGDRDVTARMTQRPPEPYRKSRMRMCEPTTLDLVPQDRLGKPLLRQVLDQ